MMVQYFMSDKELSFQQFIRNLSENKTAQEYYLSRGEAGLYFQLEMYTETQLLLLVDRFQT